MLIRKSKNFIRVGRFALQWWRIMPWEWLPTSHHGEGYKGWSWGKWTLWIDAKERSWEV